VSTWDMELEEVTSPNLAIGFLNLLICS